VALRAAWPRCPAFAQLDPDEKNRISHRGKALRQLLAALSV
jgi:inosine/xanthosine triphosphate pyrophosphatase family protein